MITTPVRSFDWQTIRGRHQEIFGSAVKKNGGWFHPFTASANVPLRHRSPRQPGHTGDRHPGPSPSLGREEELALASTTKSACSANLARLELLQSIKTPENREVFSHAWQPTPRTRKRGTNESLLESTRPSASTCWFQAPVREGPKSVTPDKGDRRAALHRIART